MSRALLYCAGGGIGDSLVASVVARALRTRYARVDAMTLPGHRSTLERVPDLDDVLVDDGTDEAAIAAQLRKRGYDACVVTWATARTAKIPQLAGIPVRVGQARRLYSGKFTNQVTVKSELGDVTTPWVQILLDYARAIDCDANDDVPNFVPTDGDVREAESLRVILSGATEGPSIILHPTNAIAPKRGIWPFEGWARLANALAERFDATVLLSGSPADTPINRQILASCHAELVEGRRIVDISGKLGIGAFGALASQAKAFVGITTGTMHVAAAVGAPTVGIFPFQSDVPDRWGPLGRRTAVVRPSFPCHAGDTKETCVDYACIAHLDVERILAAVERIAS